MNATLSRHVRQSPLKTILVSAHIVFDKSKGHDSETDLVTKNKKKRKESRHEIVSGIRLYGQECPGNCQTTRSLVAIFQGLQRGRKQLLTRYRCLKTLLLGVSSHEKGHKTPLYAVTVPTGACITGQQLQYSHISKDSNPQGPKDRMVWSLISTLAIQLLAPLQVPRSAYRCRLRSLY